MRIDLSCAECGENHFCLDTVEDDNAVITCQECGHVVGTLAEVKQQVAQQVLASA
jgi:uncharacterized Zn finger protein